MAKSSNKHLLNFEILGEGYPLVFLHGFLESNRMWDYLPLQELELQCILIELPGHGQSSLSAGVPSIKAMANRVFSTLSSLGINNFSVIGHSMGGYVALEMKKMSQALEKVILLNSNYWADSEQKKMDRLRIASFIFEAKMHFLREAIPNLFLNKDLYQREINALIKEAATISPEAIAYASIAMSKRKRNFKLLTEHLSDFFIVQGDLDPIAPKALWNPSITQNNPQYFELQECGHMANIEKSHQLFSVLKEITNNICLASTIDSEVKKDQ